ncbi:2,5-dioxovalerate dehydrogenase [Edaphobacter acidisoli]|uniref:2,5-dioxovalerate dehydrogenase n=1 Tax=Edaphobacter acidisoli TaxID=2040573 RepID=A0A916W6Y1_9BACT|nr:aldehyde dehydrogenase (NADP(+)) [Edaphobacter acidisoli]GGA72618.1 2,5-dioxovalerate dehydrogenase [Edaphobacter acidisoli]
MSDTSLYRLNGRSIVAGKTAISGGAAFHGYQPADGSTLDPEYLSATTEDVESAVAEAVKAASALAQSSGKQRAAFLRSIADGIDAASAQLVERAHRETALPVPRLTGEVARTSNQMRLFASVLEEGSWVMARIDTADPARTPPKPDIRSMLRPLGPVVVFGASNFPLAFSVAGGDTASALAAGNPVIVKAHPAHPGTSELAGQVIVDAVRKSGFPGGTFSLLFDAGHEVGAALVKHPHVCAVGFTGSFRGGRALMDLAASRPTPIPVYAEMGSTNPVFVLPNALRERSDALAAGLHGSFTLGGGQFCTKPGLVFAPRSESTGFMERMRSLTGETPAFSLLTSGIAGAYQHEVNQRKKHLIASGKANSTGYSAQVTLYEVSGDQFLSEQELSDEVFGPTTLVVQCTNTAQMLEAARSLEGHLTATILGTEEDLQQNVELLRVLETKAGRLIFNGFPTGVEVCHAQVHGGPYPATSDGRSTSVGSQAIFRFTRPVAYQGLPESALLPELQSSNPEGILRMWNGAWTRTAAEKP